MQCNRNKRRIRTDPHPEKVEEQQLTAQVIRQAERCDCTITWGWEHNCGADAGPLRGQGDSLVVSLLCRELLPIWRYVVRIGLAIAPPDFDILKQQRVAHATASVDRHPIDSPTEASDRRRPAFSSPGSRRHVCALHGADRDAGCDLCGRRNEQCKMLASVRRSLVYHIYYRPRSSSGIRKPWT